MEQDSMVWDAGGMGLLEGEVWSDPIGAGSQEA